MVKEKPRAAKITDDTSKPHIDLHHSNIALKNSKNSLNYLILKPHSQ